MVGAVEGLQYTVHKVTECLSLRRSWVPPTPSPADESVSTPLGPGRQNSLAGEGIGGPNLDDWTESLAN
jgi:hypothetical protein